MYDRKQCIKQVKEISTLNFSLLTTVVDDSLVTGLTSTVGDKQFQDKANSFTKNGIAAGGASLLTAGIYAGGSALKKGLLNNKMKKFSFMSNVANFDLGFLSHLPFDQIPHMAQAGMDAVQQAGHHIVNSKDHLVNAADYTSAAINARYNLEHGIVPYIDRANEITEAAKNTAVSAKEIVRNAALKGATGLLAPLVAAGLIVPTAVGGAAVALGGNKSNSNNVPIPNSKPIVQSQPKLHKNLFTRRNLAIGAGGAALVGAGLLAGKMYMDSNSKNSNFSYMCNNITNFNLLQVTGEGAARGALWGVGYGTVKAALNKELPNPENLAKDAALNAGAGAAVAGGIYAGGKLLSKLQNKFIG